jgi:uncharacterized RDD family membrane protein YckC
VKGVATRVEPTLQGSRAGFVSRFAADAIDLVLVLAFVGAGYLGIAAVRFLIAPRRFTWPVIGTFWLATAWWLLLIVYLAVSWSGIGRSFGKQLMGLRIERVNGASVGFGRALTRAALCAAFPVGLVWSIFSRQNASLQDLVTGTKVVYDWRPQISFPNGTGAVEA